MEPHVASPFDPRADELWTRHLILKLRAEEAEQLRGATTGGFSAAMAGAPGAAELDAVLARHGARAMRRVFRSFEDANGRRIDTARGRLERMRLRAIPPQGAGMGTGVGASLRVGPAPPLPENVPDLENYFLVEVDGMDSADDVERVIAEMRAIALVADVQPNIIHRVHTEPLPDVGVVPDDPYVSDDGATWSSGSFGNAFPDLYGVRNLRVLETWNHFDRNGNGRFDETETAPGEGIVVAVIDTGIDATHPELADAIYTNPLEVPGDGVDNDGNGYIDDVHGWNFTDDDATLEDRYGHGSHVAGTIAARANNGEGIVGVAPFAKIMPLKALDDSGGGTSADLSEAIYYATAAGAHITSNSWGGFLPDPVVRAAFDFAEAAGVLSIASAGNDGRPFIAVPALYESVVGVAAVDDTDRLASFSNRGPSLELSAPGVQVLSVSANDHDNRIATFIGEDSLVGDRYMSLNGTSMSAPHASGVAALMMSLYPEESAADIRGRLLAGAVSIDALNPGAKNNLGAGRVDALGSANAEPVPELQPIAIRPNAIVRGATVEIVIVLRNFWHGATSVYARIESRSPYLMVTLGEQDYGDIDIGGEVSRTFEVVVAPDMELGTALDLLLIIESDQTSPESVPIAIRGGYFENRDYTASLKPSPLFATGASFGDYTGDGLQDMGMGSAINGTHLYRNLPDGTFELGTPEGSGAGRFPVFADMNNDGQLDMIAVSPFFSIGVSLLQNAGDGFFELPPRRSGFAFPTQSKVVGLTPIDIDDDGDLDVAGATFQLFADDEDVLRNISILRNNGDETYSEVWAESGIKRLHGGHQILAFDWNRDALQDLLIINRYQERVFILENRGQGRFRDVTDIAFPNCLAGCLDWLDCDFFTSAAFGDYDNDGDEDLLLTISHNLFDETLPVAMLMQNDGHGVYTDVTSESGDLATLPVYMGRSGTSFFDLENDGDLDIVLPVSQMFSAGPWRSPELQVVVLRNDEDDGFTHVSDVAWPLDTPLASAILAVGDYDGDGAQDILAPVGGFVGENGGLMRNLVAQEGRWLEVELVSDRSAPFGFGARVDVFANGTRQTRMVRHSPVEAYRVHFGLDDAPTVDRIEVHWPSGVVSVLRDVAASQRIVIDERNPCPHREGSQCPVVSIDVVPFDDRNIVNLSKGTDMKAVIFGSPQLDGANIDPTTLRFGPSRTPLSEKWGSISLDLNGDRIVDLLSFFPIHETGIEPGDVELCLRGQLFDGTPFSGCDEIETQGSPKELVVSVKEFETRPAARTCKQLGDPPEPEKEPPPVRSDDGGA